MKGGTYDLSLLQHFAAYPFSRLAKVSVLYVSVCVHITPQYKVFVVSSPNVVYIVYCSIVCCVVVYDSIV